MELKKKIKRKNIKPAKITLRLYKSFYTTFIRGCSVIIMCKLNMFIKMEKTILTNK